MWVNLDSMPDESPEGLPLQADHIIILKMEKQNKPLAEKEVLWPKVITNAFKGGEVQTAVEETYSELVDYLEDFLPAFGDSHIKIKKIKKIFKDKFGFELE